MEFYDECGIEETETATATETLNESALALIEVENHNGVAVTTSLNIAKVFGKRHCDVLRDIKQALENCDTFNERKFALVEYTDTKGEKRPMYYLDRDAATFLLWAIKVKKPLNSSGLTLRRKHPHGRGEDTESRFYNFCKVRPVFNLECSNVPNGLLKPRY